MEEKRTHELVGTVVSDVNDKKGTSRNRLWIWTW